jgi:ABC-type phosphate/phosphonate transport system substrate-binding protein
MQGQYEGLTEDVIKKALMNVTFSYSDKMGTAELSALKKDVAHLADKLTSQGVINVKIKDLGFDSYEKLAEAFIDNSYLEDALKVNGYNGNDLTTVTIGLIESDVHRIAVQVGIELGFFKEYGIDVDIKFFKNGGLVAQDLLSGQSDLGFMGASPITSATINGKRIIVEDS